MTPAGEGHHSTTEPFRDYLGAYRLSHPDNLDHVYQESWVMIDGDAERFPDMAVYLKSDQTPSPIPERVPDLVFETVSPGPANRRRDYEEKRTEYERIGVRGYVIVDRFEHRVLVLGLENGNDAETFLGPEDSYNAPLLPGLEIPLAGVI